MPGNAGRLCAAVLVLLAHNPALAQLRSLENPSFEANDPAGPGAPSFQILPSDQVPGWETTTAEIELWDSRFNGVPAFEGNVFAEMNANRNGTFFQNICLITGEPISWTFAHRARSGGPSTQTVRFQVANSAGAVLQSLATQASRTSNPVWNVNNGSTTYSGPSGLQRVQFTTSDPGSLGNFLDAIRLNLRPFVQLAASSTTGLEANPALPGATLLITGSTPNPINVNVVITGGTAVRGRDYTTPSGGAAFTVTIPAGTYFNSPIPLGIAVIDDADVEGSETITYALSSGTGYTLAHTTDCGAAVQTTSTHTITDNDARLTLRKQWVNAVTGDRAIVTVTRNAAVLDTLVSDAGSAGDLDIDPTSTPVNIGDTLMLAEAMAPGNAGNYQASLACTGTADTNLSDGLTVGPGEVAVECTYTNARLVPLVVSKTSTVLADGAGSTNPKAIPGATIRYCIEVSNPGTLPVEQVSVIDNLPVSLTFVAGSVRTGSSCMSATISEDDDALGPDESDPYGSAFSGSTLTGTVANLGGGASFAILFDARLN
ncbi:hypothetical protein CHX26_09290 [Porphyrobacter sp. HT-58-2]|nr:hypothetical protein CHX26_09290 [Porphyrobacter sp. HT-58-2]